MRVLLLGEYSNVHATLAKGLRRLGHEVTVASDGDYWKGYPRDIDLRRRSCGLWDTLAFWLRLERALPKFRGYDAVQLISPADFLRVKAGRQWRVFRRLKAANRAVFMGAFGMDYYYAAAARDCRTFRYSDFNIGSRLRRNADTAGFTREWIEGEKGEVNRRVAEACDGIVAGLYEYYEPYRRYCPSVAADAGKLAFIPFPIDCAAVGPPRQRVPERVRFFIGLQRGRSEYKGTDVMWRALERVGRDFPDDCEIVRVESVPFSEYRRLLGGSDVLLDQLYSYTPAMNALEAMAQGLVVVGGGEPENYEIIGERGLRPVVNVQPDEESVYAALRSLVLHKERIPRLSAEGVAYVRKHHDMTEVARRYAAFWQSRM